MTYYYRCYASNMAGTGWAPATTSFTAVDSPGPGQVWSGRGGADDRWATDANWNGNAMPGRRATSAVVFAIADVGNTNLLDIAWLLRGGLMVNNTNGTHLTDLDGNKLTLDGCDLKVGRDAASSSIMFTNGTLRLGDTPPANVYIGRRVGAVSAGTLTIGSTLFMNVSNVYVGDYVTGVLDLRGANAANSTFSCPSKLVLGTAMADASFQTGSGTVYLNDKNGVITNVVVGSLCYGSGTLVLNPGTGIRVGSPSSPGMLVVGAGRNAGANASLAPDGEFSAYLDRLDVGIAASAVTAVGTLNLSNAVTRDIIVSSTATIGDNTASGGGGTGRGLVTLGRCRGNAYFANLVVGGGTAANSVLRLWGCSLKVGNSLTNVFLIGSTNTVIIDLSNWTSELAVYGEGGVSGPATGIPTYLADRRIVVTNGIADVWYDGEYTRIGRQKGMVLQVR